ncbi:MAG: hypothetical protein RR490_10550, partial [Niameybacter sp.]
EYDIKLDIDLLPNPHIKKISYNLPTIMIIENMPDLSRVIYTCPKKKTTRPLEPEERYMLEALVLKRETLDTFESKDRRKKYRDMLKQVKFPDIQFSICDESTSNQELEVCKTVISNHISELYKQITPTAPQLFNEVKRLNAMKASANINNISDLLEETFDDHNKLPK